MLVNPQQMRSPNAAIRAGYRVCGRTVSRVAIILAGQTAGAVSQRHTQFYTYSGRAEHSSTDGRIAERDPGHAVSPATTSVATDRCSAAARSRGIGHRHGRLDGPSAAGNCRRDDYNGLPSRDDHNCHAELPFRGPHIGHCRRRKKKAEADRRIHILLAIVIYRRTGEWSVSPSDTFPRRPPYTDADADDLLVAESRTSPSP